MADLLIVHMDERNGLVALYIMMLESLVSIGSHNSLMLDSSKSLPETMFYYHQYDPTQHYILSAFTLDINREN